MLPLELVSIIDDVPKTTSLIVADYFGKRHADVLRAIEKLDCSKEFNERNFALVDYLDEQGKFRRMVNMTKDGFVFLVMGFTGKKSAQFKEAYINEFNRMADFLNKKNSSLMYQYNKVSLEFDMASKNASEAGRALSILGKQVKPTMRERLEQLEKQMQMVLNFTNEKADTVRQDEMSAQLSIHKEKESNHHQYNTAKGVLV